MRLPETPSLARCTASCFMDGSSHGPKHTRVQRNNPAAADETRSNESRTTRTSKRPILYTPPPTPPPLASLIGRLARRRLPNFIASQACDVAFRRGSARSELCRVLSRRNRFSGDRYARVGLWEERAVRLCRRYASRRASRSLSRTNCDRSRR